MHVIRIQSVKNSNIYRIVQVPASMTIFDFDTVIATAFTIEEENDVFYQSTRLNGKKNSQMIALYSDESDEFESLEETVGNWFKKIDDEMHYINEADISLKLTLDNMIDIDGLDACIIEGQGDLFSRRRKINVEKLNEALQQEIELEQSLFTEGFNSFSKFLEPNYLTLFEVAEKLKQLKPWLYFENGDIIAVQLHDMKYFISVMGAGGQEYGLMMYDEAYGYPSLEKILKDEPLSDDYSFDVSALTVNYVDRTELEKDDYELIKEHGLSFRGKKNWIAFRTFEPGFLPMQPDYSQVEDMIELLEIVIEVTKTRMRGWQYPELPIDSFPLFERQRDERVKMVGILTLEPLERELEMEVNDFDIAKIKKKPKGALEVEFDFFYLQYPIIGEDERPIYPLISVIVNHHTGEIINHEIVPFPKHSFVQQQLFWQCLKNFSIRPRKIFVTAETHRYLKPVAQLVGIELAASTLPNVEVFKEMVKYNPPF